MLGAWCWVLGAGAIVPTAACNSPDRSESDNAGTPAVVAARIPPGFYLGSHQSEYGAVDAWVLLADSLGRAAIYMPMEMLAICSLEADSTGRIAFITEKRFSGPIAMTGVLAGDSIVGTLDEHRATPAAPIQLALRRVSRSLPRDSVSGVYLAPQHSGAETGDVGGQEVVVVRGDSGWWAAMAFIEGWPGFASAVRSVIRSGDTLAFEMDEPAGRTRIARLRPDSLLFAGGAGFPDSVSLGRVTLDLHLKRAWDSRGCTAPG